MLGDPRNADYRMTLAQANLSAGHFASAETLFHDVLTLDPNHPRAGLNLALTQIALDHGADARATLDAHREQIAPADLGLAYALAGDPTSGVRVLESAAREDTATAKTRQNLALAYALAGRWDDARVAASQDLSPDLVEKRMSDWAQMAHPRASWEQVATLLHVTPTNDPGLPYQLALRDTSAEPVRAAEASAPVAPAAQPQAQVVAEAAPASASASAPAPRYETAATQSVEAPVVDQPKPAVATAPAPVAFAPHKPVVQHVSTPAPLIAAEHAPSKRFVAERARVKALAVAYHAAPPVIRTAAHHRAVGGHFAVQIGAFPSANVAHSAWQHDVKKVALLQHYDPAGSTFKLQHASFYRLSVTGFSTHQEAAAVCAKLHAAGNACFVRGVAGDQLAAWARPSGAVHLAKASHVAPKATVAAVKPAKAVKPAPKSAPAPTQAASKPVAKPSAKPAPKQTASAQHGAAGGQLAAKR